MAVAEIISVLKTIKLGYDIIKCIDKILKERLQESSNRVISHNTNVINEIIRKREYFSAKDNDLYMKKAMIRPLALIGAKMGVLCDNTVSLHSELLSKLNYKNTIEEYIENSTILYNRFKDIILFDPDFPILMGYKSVTEDLPFPEKNHDVRLTGNKEGNKKKLDIAEIEGCIKWSLKKAFLSQHHAETAEAWKNICKTHRQFHELLWERYKILLRIETCKNNSASIDFMIPTVEKNTKELQETEQIMDELLISSSGFSNMVSPKYHNQYTIKPDTLVKQVYKGASIFAKGVYYIGLWPVRLSSKNIRSTKHRLISSNKYNTEDISEYILKKDVFSDASVQLGKALSSDKEKTLSLLYRCYQLLFLTKVVDERFDQLSSEINECADMLNFDQESRVGLAESFIALANEVGIQNQRKTYKRTIDRMVGRMKFPTKYHEMDMKIFTTPLMQTIAPILTNMNPINEDETIDTLKNELLALREFMEQIATLSYGRLDETEIERYLKFVDKAIATNFRLNSIEEELKDLQDRVEKLEHITQNSM